MEKIELDLFNLGTIHKKLIGVDGLKNEYYFYNSIPNKIFKKCFKKNTDNKQKLFEWSVINSDEDVKALLTSLSEKGIRETNLAHKLKKLLNKKLKILPNQNTAENKSEEEILKRLLSNSSKMDTEEDFERKFLIENFERLENDISEYLNQDKKEWESFITRQDIIAFMNSSDSITELGKCLILLNERFKNPYKQNDYKTKVISDEEDYTRGSVIDIDGKIDLNYIDDKKVLAPKGNLYSKNIKFHLFYDKINLSLLMR